MLHRCLAVIAAMFLLNTMRGLWGAAIEERPAFGILMIATCGSAVALAILAATVRTTRAMLVVDAGIFLVALGELVTAARLALVAGRPSLATDVGMLVQAGAQALHDGEHLYGVPHPDAYALYSSGSYQGGTSTAEGTMTTDYGYPPLGAVFTAALLPFIRGMAGPTIAAHLGVVAAALLLFFLLPTPMRPAAALTCLLFPRIEDYASSGYPGLMALPFMVVAVAAWPTLGSTGRLRWRGLLSAVCLGLGIATHQLAWFVAPFLVVGIWLVRWGHLGGRGSTLLTLRYVGTTLATFLVANAWFIAQDPGAWLAGITEPLTQKSMPHGQGIVGLINFYSYGSGSLGALGTAALLMLLGLLIVFALYIRQLGPAATILPWLAFFFAVRSQDSYYILMAPLWVLGVATWTHRRWLAQAHQLRLPLPRLGERPVTRLAAAALLPVMALAAVGVALVSPVPLKITVEDLHVNPIGDIWRVDATVTNRSSDTLVPKFAVTEGRDTIGRFWTAIAGPVELAPGQTAQYQLVTPNTGVDAPNPPVRLYLRAITAEPMTLSSVPLNARSTPKRISIVGPVLTAPLKPGEPYDMYLQLMDYQDRDLARAGVPVTMTATWLSSDELINGEVTVNGKKMRAGTWEGVTDAKGRIQLRLVAAKGQTEPIVFRTTSPRSPDTLTLFWRG
ncbi:hypothetical protein ACFQX7_07705 [Luedemannella flava]